MSKPYCPECGKQGCFGWFLWMALVLVIGGFIGFLVGNSIKFSSPNGAGDPRQIPPTTKSDTFPSDTPALTNFPPPEPVSVTHVAGPALTNFSSPSSEADASILSTSAFTFDDLLDAIEWVEIKGDPNAVGDGGAAVGAYQIHKIYVDDVNRILGYTRYSYKDRLNWAYSREMVIRYIKHYYCQIKLYEALPEIISFDATPFQFAARIHNGGPSGWKKESTKPYWAKVKARMEAK